MNKKNVIVLLHANDSSLKSFLFKSDKYNIKIFTPMDLSTPGWYYDDRKENNRCVIGEEILPIRNIDGVITRLPAITQDQLPQIIPSDRFYLASEMTAFLLAWLNSLNCPKLNEPTASCLSGPYLHPEQWVNFAAKLGIPVVKHAHRIKIGLKNNSVPMQKSASVTVIGDFCLGNVHQRLVDYAKIITRASGIEFLAVNFSNSEKDARFLSADLWPAITTNTARLMCDHVVNGQAGIKQEG